MEKFERQVVRISKAFNLTDLINRLVELREEAEKWPNLLNNNLYTLSKRLGFAQRIVLNMPPGVLADAASLKEYTVDEVASLGASVDYEFTDDLVRSLRSFFEILDTIAYFQAELSQLVAAFCSKYQGLDPQVLKFGDQYDVQFSDDGRRICFKLEPALLGHSVESLEAVFDLIKGRPVIFEGDFN